MTEIWTQAALWMGLALIATLVAIWLRVATALSEIVIGTVEQLIIGATLGSALLAADASWLKFLAGAELDPTVFRRPVGADGLKSDDAFESTAREHGYGESRTQLRPRVSRNNLSCSLRLGATFYFTLPGSPERQVPP